LLVYKKQYKGTQNEDTVGQYYGTIAQLKNNYKVLLCCDCDEEEVEEVKFVRIIDLSTKDNLLNSASELFNDVK